MNKKINAENVVFDSHMHVLNVADVCLSAYLSFVETNKVQESLATMQTRDYIFSSVAQSGMYAMSGVLNALESSHCASLKLLEDDLRGVYEKKPIQPVVGPNGIALGNKMYQKMLIQPLIMDFAPSQFKSGAYYDKFPEHPVTRQAAHLLEGIKQYRTERPDGALIVRPFMGINPARWTIQQIDHLLQTHFNKWTGDAAKVFATWDKIPRLKVREDKPYAAAFAGVKLYPPLGFDPWPDDSREREKVALLYSYCERRGIPLISHCDDQGFRMIAQETSFVFTSPERWEEVLKRYPELYLDIAHFGKQYHKSLLFKSKTSNWSEKILDLAYRFPHVYTDMSFNGSDASAWPALTELIDTLPVEARETVFSRILYGTDWPLSLTKVESATAYWHNFAGSTLSSELKIRFANENPSRFLFR